MKRSDRIEQLYRLRSMIIYTTLWGGTITMRKIRAARDQITQIDEEIAELTP